MLAQVNETVLSTISGSSDYERLLVVLCITPGHGSRLELRQQSFGAGVGWFTQSTVVLEPHQVAELRGALGSGHGRSARSGSNLPREFSRVAPNGFSPRVVHADSA